MKDATCKLNSMTHRGRAAGFTLIEIMIAIGILVVGLTGVIALYAVAVDAHKSAVEQSGAAALAESMLSGITADFTARVVDDDNTATFLESYVDLAGRYKFRDAAKKYIPERGVEAPNSPGFTCEVSIYPLPRRLWVEATNNVALPDEVTQFLNRIESPEIRQRTQEQYQWDILMLDLYDDASGSMTAKRQILKNVLAQALEYKVVVKAIRGEGVKKRVDIFETIITPRGIADKQVP